MSDAVMFCFGACYTCRRPFSFAPTKVPSVRINGVKQPICKRCVDEVNPKRIANGLDPIVPLPGAYEPEDASNVY